MAMTYDVMPTFTEFIMTQALMMIFNKQQKQYKIVLTFCKVPWIPQNPVNVGSSPCLHHWFGTDKL
jgi:hypothetical protein